MDKNKDYVHQIWEGVISCYIQEHFYLHHSKGMKVYASLAKAKPTLNLG